MKIKKIPPVIIMILLFCGFCSSYIVVNSIKEHQSEDIETLMITENDLSKDWKFDYIKPITGDFEWGTENRSKVFVVEPERGIIRQYIYMFDNRYNAMYAHFFLKRNLVLVKENKNPFLEYRSPVADDWYLACDYNNSNGPVCDALGRYKNYIIYFSISADKEVLNSEQLLNILQSIDERMKTFLSAK